MATDEPSPPEGAKSVAPDNNDSDQIELSPGEELTGRIVTMRSVDTDYGESGILTLETEDGEIVDYFCKGEAKQAFLADNLARGDKIWLAKLTEEEEYNGSSYYPTRCMVVEDGGDS